MSALHDNASACVSTYQVLRLGDSANEPKEHHAVNPILCPLPGNAIMRVNHHASLSSHRD